MKLKIHYRDRNDEVTVRTISDIDLDPPHQIHAYCHLRKKGRSFVLKSIENAIDLETGVQIPDIFIFFGLDSIKRLPPKKPEFSELPNPMSTEEAQRLRKADKLALFRPFVYPVIAEHAKAKLFELFENQCFRCKRKFELEIDHHVPQYLSGRLVSGNLVVLCKRCNMEKSDKNPKIFYSLPELSRLEILLQMQLDIFDFEFSWRKWERNRKVYLSELGISHDLIDKIFSDTDHPLYMGSA